MEAFKLNESEANNYDVLELDTLAIHPFCKHGPTILFSNDKKKFYSCSACRNHKMCNFYAEHNESKPISEEKLTTWFDRYKNESDQLLSVFKEM